VDGRRAAPVRQENLRAHNLALVLSVVASAPLPPSRADVATATGLTRATVSALVDDLIGGRLIEEVGPAPRAGAGRPAAGLVISACGPGGLGLEVNVDYLAACVVDLTGAVRHRAVRGGDQRALPAAEVLTGMATLAAEARAAAHAEGLALAGAALAVPGLVTPSGVVRLAPNLGWRDVDVPAALSGALGLPVGVDNEANLAALASPAGVDSYVYVSGEIGIGAGIVLHGELFRGARGWSGELGHVCVRPDGPPCRCGARGCLEQYAGQEALLRTAGVASVAELAAAVAGGAAGAAVALATAGEALGVAIAGMINLLDVDTVVLGGIYAPLAPWLVPAVEAEVRVRVLTAGWAPVTVRASALGSAAAVVGAAGSVVRGVRDDPARWLQRPAAVR
jgi:predicted NBD/HSP70 family sugar kinase